jgi:hypothetical protein
MKGSKFVALLRLQFEPSFPPCLGDLWHSMSPSSCYMYTEKNGYYLLSDMPYDSYLEEIISALCYEDDPLSTWNEKEFADEPLTFI